MNISYNWLKDLVDFDFSPADLAQKLTNVGLAVEAVHRRADDFVFNIDLTSNRSDCLSHLGVGREVAVIQNSNLKIQNTADGRRQTAEKIENLTNVVVEDAELCPRYTAQIVRGVKIGASPEWLIKRLEAVGERSINNVADVTNYVMHELGQPLHAFDFNKLKGKRIVVRRARTGEKMTTLDGAEREFDETMLLICDAERAVAIGGVMGGADSAISENTTDVLIEAAFFKPENVRQTSRKLNLTTEASYRFERGTDIEMILRASNRCAELICQIAGGVATDAAIDVYPIKRSETIVSLRPGKVAELTGLKVEQAEMKRILRSLGFDDKGESAKSDGRGENRLIFAVPSWRHDIEREEDLIEEIARHTGYENIKEELPPAFGAGAYQPNEKRKKAIRRALADLSFNEALSYSFIDARHDAEFELLPSLALCQTAEKFVTLQDSIIEGAVRMRPTLLPGLLDAVRENFNHGNRDVQLFEIGRIFAANERKNELPVERESFAFVLTGGRRLANRAETNGELNFYDAKGALEAAISIVNLPAPAFSAAKIKHLQTGQAAEIFFKNEKIGTIGKLSDAIATNYKFRQAVFVCEIDLQKLLENQPQNVLYKPLPKFPAIRRDVSFLIKRAVTFGEIQKFIEQLNVELCRAIEFVGEYAGKGIADDERSLTIRLEYRSDKATLQDAEAEKAHQQIISAVENEFRARLRF
jgi:phenylalanyl-tRNA synthetase beta chain